MEEDRQMLKAQREEYQVATFKDELREILNPNLNSLIDQGVPRLLRLYQNMVTFCESAPFAGEMTQIEIDTLQERTLTEVDRLIAEQVKLEEESLRMQAEREKELSTLKDLLSALENNNTDQIHNLFLALPAHTQKTLLEKKVVPATYRRPDFNFAVYGIPEKKIETIKALKGALQSLPALDGPNLSEQLLFLKQEALAPKIQVAPQETFQLQNANQRDALQRLSDRLVNLQEIEALIQNNNLPEALFLRAMLESQRILVPFKILSTGEQNIGTRPDYHLYLIHSMDNKRRLPDDLLYGNKAMAGEYSATSLERQRAFIRTRVELALEGLEQAVALKEEEEIIRFLNILEAIPLNSQDLPPGIQRLTNELLFGKYYYLHKAARINCQNLVDPDNNAEFHHNFGQIAFSRVHEGIDPAIKIAAINTVRDALAAVWNSKK
jgi:hypothetical protein